MIDTFKPFGLLYGRGVHLCFVVLDFLIWVLCVVACGLFLGLIVLVVIWRAQATSYVVRGFAGV